VILVLAAALGCTEESPRGTDASAPDAPRSIDACAGCVRPDTTPSWDASECPAEVPVGGAPCSEGASCPYGEETCCGDTYPATICECHSGQFLCYATDACLIPSCPDAG